MWCGVVGGGQKGAFLMDLRLKDSDADGYCDGDEHAGGADNSGDAEYDCAVCGNTGTDNVDDGYDDADDDGDDDDDDGGNKGADTVDGDDDADDDDAE